MKYDYQYVIPFKENSPFSIDYVNEICNKHPNNKFLIEVQNTRGITSSILRKLAPNSAIRIAGGYDEERVNRNKNVRFVNGETGDYYTEAVIYTKNEAIKILEEIEKIESGINANWSDVQKIVYVYDKLMTGIMYDPKFEHKLSSEIRSLRGLITKQTVCAGYAMILKEIMDRHSIDCEYVEGYTSSDKKGAHAWNIVNIDGKKYPIDLTWDNTNFRSGQFGSYAWLGQDIKTFCKSHYPHKEEKTQNYNQTLSQINPQIIKQISSQVKIEREYETTTYLATRNDGSKFVLAQIGNSEINKVKYYRYYYAEILPNGKMNLPLILYSETNVSRIMNCKNFGKPMPPNCEKTVTNILFSKENIAESISRNTYYIGRMTKGKNKDNKSELISSVSEIEKPKEKADIFTYPTKRYIRSDGSIIIAQQMLEKPMNINGIKVMKYDILEMVNENGKSALRKNSVYTEQNFFKDTRQSMIDDYLSRERLDRKVKESGGYIGYYDAGGMRRYNPQLVSYFGINKKIDINATQKKPQGNKVPTIPIPTFDELHAYAIRFEIFIDSDNPYDSNPAKIKIRDIKTKQIQTDKSIIDKAMFANIWLKSAGVKQYPYDQTRTGEYYAFCDPARELYSIICKELANGTRTNGVIDPAALYRDIENKSVYKYNKEVIENLFRTPFQTEFINNIFLQSQGITRQSQTPKPLYRMSYSDSEVLDPAYSSRAM